MDEMPLLRQEAKTVILLLVGWVVWRVAQAIALPLAVLGAMSWLKDWFDGKNI